MSEDTNTNTTPNAAEAGATGNQTPITTQQTTPPPTGKTWTDDYVQALREEAKTNRLAKKALEQKIRAVLGLKDDEELSDSRIDAFKVANEKAISDAMAKANERLIAAEIRGATEYNTKLAEKLIDRSKIAVDENGNVIGVKEALAALEIEFPEIKKGGNQSGASGANPPNQSGVNEADKLKGDYDDAIKAGRLADAIAIKNKIFELNKK